MYQYHYDYGFLIITALSRQNQRRGRVLRRQATTTSLSGNQAVRRMGGEASLYAESSCASNSVFKRLNEKNSAVNQIYKFILKEGSFLAC